MSTCAHAILSLTQLIGLNCQCTFRWWTPTQKRVVLENEKIKKVNCTPNGIVWMAHLYETVCHQLLSNICVSNHVGNKCITIFICQLIQQLFLVPFHVIEQKTNIRIRHLINEKIKYFYMLIETDFDINVMNFLHFRRKIMIFCTNFSSLKIKWRKNYKN